MPWRNMSPPHMKAEKDQEHMRRSWEDWWYGRTGEHIDWERYSDGIIRQIYADKKQRQPTGCLLIVFAPGGVWFDTHHEWDRYTFNVLIQREPGGAFEEDHQTGWWLRNYTSIYAIGPEPEDKAREFLRTSNHPWCKQHRRARQYGFLDWQRKISYAWGMERIRETLKMLAGPDEPIEIKL